jgi:hypothetical protein
MNDLLIYIEKLKPIVELSTALIPFAILYIAYQQYKTNKMKLKNDLFDKRYAAFESVNNYITTIAKGNSVDLNQREEFLSKTRGVEFLFDDEMKKYITEVWDKATEFKAWAEDEKTSTRSGENIEHAKWFSKQRTEINLKFKKYMYLSH